MVFISVGQKIVIKNVDDTTLSKVVKKGDGELVINAPHLYYRAGQPINFTWQDKDKCWWGVETWVKRLDWDERPLVVLVWPGVIEYLGDRRHINRKHAHLPAMIHVTKARAQNLMPTQPVGITITELSSQGLCFKSNWALTPGDKLRIRVSMPDGELIEGPITIKRIFGVNAYSPQVAAIFDPSDRATMKKWTKLLGKIPDIIAI